MMIDRLIKLVFPIFEFFRQFFFDNDGNFNNIEIAALVAVSRNFYLFYYITLNAFESVHIVMNTLIA